MTITRSGMGWVARGILAAAWAGGLAWGTAWADDLPVSLSDYPRIIKRDLPKMQPGRGVRLGVLRLHPTFQTTAEYDDNIRLSPSDEKEDIVFTQMPGVMGEAGFGRHRVTGGYWAEIINFADESEENAVNHIANGSVNFDLGHLGVKVTDGMENTTSRLFNEDSSRDRLFLNAAGVRARYDRPKWVFEGGVKNNRTEHRLASRDVDDRTENVASLLIGRKVASKTTLFAEGVGGHVNYDSNTSNADHRYWQASLGFAYQAFSQKWDEDTDSLERDTEGRSRLRATVKVGFQDRQLSDVGGQGHKADFENVVADAVLEYRPKPLESITLGYLRAPEISTFGSNEWYRTDKVTLSWKKRLLRKLYAIPRFSWQRHDYPEPSTISGVTARREDDLLQFQGELRYEPRVDPKTGEAWVWAGLFYTFRNRDSDFDTLDFDNSRVGVKIGFSY